MAANAPRSRPVRAGHSRAGSGVSRPAAPAAETVYVFHWAASGRVTYTDPQGVTHIIPGNPGLSSLADAESIVLRHGATLADTDPAPQRPAAQPPDPDPDDTEP